MFFSIISRLIPDNSINIPLSKSLNKNYKYLQNNNNGIIIIIIVKPLRLLPVALLMIECRCLTKTWKKDQRINRPGTSRHREWRSFYQIKTPIFLHVVSESQTSDHRHGNGIRFHLRLTGQQVRIKRGVRLHQLSLQYQRCVIISEKKWIAFDSWNSISHLTPRRGNSVIY